MDEKMISAIKKDWKEMDALCLKWFVSEMLDSPYPDGDAHELHCEIFKFMTFGLSPEQRKEAEIGGQDPDEEAEEFVCRLTHNARTLAKMLLKFADNPTQPPNRVD